MGELSLATAKTDKAACIVAKSDSSDADLAYKSSDPCKVVEHFDVEKASLLARIVRLSKSLQACIDQDHFDAQGNSDLADTKAALDAAYDSLAAVSV